MITRANDRALRAAFKSIHSHLAHETGLPDRWGGATGDAEKRWIAAERVCISQVEIPPEFWWLRD